MSSETDAKTLFTRMCDLAVMAGKIGKTKARAMWLYVQHVASNSESGFRVFLAAAKYFVNLFCVPENYSELVSVIAEPNLPPVHFPPALTAAWLAVSVSGNSDIESAIDVPNIAGTLMSLFAAVSSGSVRWQPRLPTVCAFVLSRLLRHFPSYRRSIQRLLVFWSCTMLGAQVAYPYVTALLILFPMSAASVARGLVATA
jgi:predicted SnoaL-like aldol condensation-catalyzing enzyme